MKVGTSLFFPLIMTLSCHSVLHVLGKRQFSEEELELAKNSGIDIDSLSDDTVFITPPKLSDEEQGSKFMPKAYRCDGCKAVAYKLVKSFAAAEKQKKPGERLSESEAIDAVENVCKSDFENYGLKNFKGEKMLAGEGLKGEKVSGMVQTGGIWKERFQNICQDLVGHNDEDEIYDWYAMNKIPFEDILCQEYCDSKMLRPSPKDEF